MKKSRIEKNFMRTTVATKIKKKEGFQGQKAIVIPRSVLSSNCESNPIIASMHITDIGYYPNAKFHYIKRVHGADQHILIYCIKGKGKVTVEKEKYQLDPGNFIIIPRNAEHQYSADENDPWTIYWVHFSGSQSNLVRQYMENIAGSIKGFVHYDQQRTDLFNLIYEQLNRGYGIENMVYANMCFHHYLASYMRPMKANATHSSSESDVVNMVIDFMKKNIGSTFTLQQMSNEANISPSHLSFLFKKKTGYPPIEYFNHLKVQQACQYLLFTDMRIKTISDMLGIDDPYYFSRFFKKLMGVSPNIYRERKNQ